MPLALPGNLTYSVPDEWSGKIQPGVRVIVPVGKRKFYSAVVENVTHDFSGHYAVKEIVAVLDNAPVVNPLQFRLWHWIASYYLCTAGEVMKAAIPSGLKLESETKVFFNTEYVQCDELNTHEEEILHIVCEKHNMTVKEITALYKRKDIMRVVQSLVDKGALWVEEVMAGRYKPKSERYVRLHPSISDENSLKQVFETLEKAPRQLEILVNYVQLSGIFSRRELKEVRKKDLLSISQSPADTLNRLAEKNILESYTKEISRLADAGQEAMKVCPLTEPQETAFREIKESFTGKEVVLLHGVTSSGKTEIYIRLIEEQIAQGKQVLYLLPEIALTAQIINRLRSVFGNKVGIYHSKFSDAERVEVWNNITGSDGYSVVLSVRSGIFLPFSDLGLVIVDEEHESSYKQYDPAPRYHARDAAIMLAAIHGAKTLLGTATPSIETYYNAIHGKYGWVELTERYTGIALPDISVVDIRPARGKLMHSLFHPRMIEEITETLNKGKQVILFQNRRGFAPYVQCRICDEIPKCEYCDVSLTYHKFSNRLVCHYCGYSTANITQCPRCGGLDISDVSFGTEKIEDEIRLFFPDARISRLDLDTSRSRNSYEKIITDFEQGKTDILIGTQMISKGLDFDHVNLVGILNADQMFHFPDFRAFERSFQLISQVGGRAGRYGERGKVLIQTKDPGHPVLQYVLANDYTGMFHSQLAEREKFRYPPFYRLIRLTLKHKSKELVHQAAAEFAAVLVQVFGRRVLGPEIPLIARLQTYYLENILLKIEKQASIQQTRDLLNKAICDFRQHPSYKSLLIVADVDPV